MSRVAGDPYLKARVVRSHGTYWLPRFGRGPDSWQIHVARVAILIQWFPGR